MLFDDSPPDQYRMRDDSARLRAGQVSAWQ
jgi:hypothetical protein